MAHTYHLEIKTFTISKGIQRSTLSAEEIGTSVFNLNNNIFNQTTFISAFKEFIQQGFDALTASDGFIVNESVTRKFRIVELNDNHEYNSFFGIYIGGTIGEKGKFNKKRNGSYQSEMMGPEDFTDIPFMFYIHFPVGSSVGVLMLYRTGSRSMNQDIKDMLKQIFFNKGYTLRFQIFISENQKEKFKSFSTVEKIIISQNVRGASMDDPYTFFQSNKEYRVKIEISGINESATKYFSRLFNLRKKNKLQDISKLFPEFKDLGISSHDASIKTIIKEDGGNISRPDFKEYETYLDKLLPKINLGAQSSVEYGKTPSSFEYTELLSELNTILEEEVFPTLYKEDESK